VTVPTYIAESRGNWSAAGTENLGNFIGLRIIHIGWFSGVLFNVKLVVLRSQLSQTYHLQRLPQPDSVAMVRHGSVTA